MATAKNKTNNKVGKDMKKREHSNAIGGNVNWWSHWAKQYRGLLKNLIYNYHITQQFLSWVYLSAKNKNTNLKRYVHRNVYVVVQLPSHVQLFESPWTKAR